MSPDADDRMLAERVAELAHFAAPQRDQTVALLVEFLRYFDEYILPRPDDPFDSGEIALGMISSVGLELSRADWRLPAEDLAVDDLPDALLSFTDSILAPQLSYAGLIDLHPPNAPGLPAPLVKRHHEVAGPREM